MIISSVIGIAWKLNGDALPTKRNFYGEIPVRTSLAEISTYSGIYRLLKKMGLPRLNPLFWERYSRNKKKIVNCKAEKKITRLLPGNIDALEKEVERLFKNTLTDQMK